MRLKHHGTGAEHLHVAADDPENTFGVVFKTLPEDSTGVAHILEHTTLCGSEKYPVRDPFTNMLSRSLNTYMNAFTGLFVCFSLLSSIHRSALDGLRKLFDQN